MDGVLRPGPCPPDVRSNAGHSRLQAGTVLASPVPVTAEAFHVFSPHFPRSFLGVFWVQGGGRSGSRSAREGGGAATTGCLSALGSLCQPCQGRREGPRWRTVPWSPRCPGPQAQHAHPTLSEGGAPWDWKPDVGSPFLCFHRRNLECSCGAASFRLPGPTGHPRERARSPPGFEQEDLAPVVSFPPPWGGGAPAAGSFNPKAKPLSQCELHRLPVLTATLLWQS